MTESQFFKDLKKYFGEKDLYKIYKLNRKCTTAQIKTAYKKLSLLYHPDRNDEALKEESKIKFQLVSKIHQILSDNDKRALYDENGMVHSDCYDDDNFKNWEEYWRNIYPKVTVNDIKSFEEKYKNSVEEKEDLKKFYLQFEGNFNQIMDNLMCAEVSDEDRYRTIVHQLIQSKEVPPFDAFLKESQVSIKKRKRKAEKENKEFEESSKAGDISDLALSIKRSQQQRESQSDAFFDNLLAKHAPKPRANKRKK